MGEMRNTHKTVENPEGKGQSGRGKRRWEDAIRMDLREKTGKV
jgi:hypothetical protein